MLLPICAQLLVLQLMTGVSCVRRTSISNYLRIKSVKAREKGGIPSFQELAKIRNRNGAKRHVDFHLRPNMYTNNRHFEGTPTLPPGTPGENRDKSPK